MAYVKNIWVDQEVERPRTYQKIDNADGSFTLIDDFGLVSELGTPVNADNMNHIEEGIEAGSFTKYDGSATYFENDLVTSFLDEDLVIYKSLKDNNKGNPLTDANYWEEIKLGGGAGQPIGTIYALNCTKDYVPEGSLPCDGTEYTKGQFPSLWDNYIATALLNTCTYEEYATDLATYGQCGKFAVDTTNNTFRVPLIKDKFITDIADIIPSCGNGTSLGLTDGTYYVGLGESTDTGRTYVNTRFYNTANGTESGSSSYATKNDVALGVTTDANASGIVTTTANHKSYLEVRHFVVVANGSINQSQMDWSQWASNLQAKMNADHSNDPYFYVKEMYQNGTSWYVLYSNGWCMQGGRSAVATATTTITLLKNYSTTNYSLSLTGSAGYPFITSRATDSFTADTSSASTVDWEAKGYIA